MIGLRAEFDVWRISALVTLDRTATTPFTLAETQHWTALGGASLLAGKWYRLRALGGVSVLSTALTTSIAPTLGLNGRLLWHFIGLEAAGTLTPFGAFQTLDGRIELILRGGVFELHAGYRVRLLAETGTLATATPIAGPHAALGLSF